ncbi:MAG: T9SS type A sorting domain-containing protein [Bacteroidales bacterium]|nr:T9SS type A sorting domain-containing protein [Bacteroidales bacterium]
MKNVLLALMMLFALHTFAQSTHTIDFEPGGTGADWTWNVGENADNPPLEFTANPDNSGLNTSATAAKFTVRQFGNPWALCLTSGDGEFTFDATNSIVKIMVYKPNISNVGMKFEGLSGAIEIQVPNTLINQWEEITFDFSGKIGSTYSLIVIIPDFDFTARPGDRIIYFDNIQVPDGFLAPPPPEPTTAPLIPPHAQENVLSIYSDAYANLPGTNFNPNWSQVTQVTVDYVAAGNNTLRYMNLNYQGTQFGSNQDVSGYEYIHVDFWTPNSTLLRFFVISPGAETFYTLPITAETWVSVDIPLTHFVPPVNLADVFQFKVDGNGTVFFDNWYFWKNPSNTLADATLSDLQVDGTTVPGFAPNIFSYDVELPFGTTEVPVVTATTTNPAASHVVNPAAALPGTTEVVVTAEDEETMQTYAVNFTVAGPVPTSAYCETLVYHFGITAELPSAVFLTITNLDASSMLVEVSSANADPVDLLIVTGGSGAAVSGENTSVPGKISRTLSWVGTPPSDVTLNVLWSKVSFEGNWMLSQGDITVPFEAVCEPAGPAAITFRVDMSEYAGEFTNVYVSGSFNGWSGDANQLLDPDMDDVYEAELLLENGNYEYKFTLDNWNVQEEFQGGEPCVITSGGYHNRALTVTGSTALPLVCWNSCYACGEEPQPKNVTFRVDLAYFSGNYSNVYVSGNFNGWCGDCNQMTDPDMDGVYETTLSLMDGMYEYKFTMDNWAIQEEFMPGEPCTMTTGPYTNRVLTVDADVVLTAVCWNSCDICPDYTAGWHGISSNVIPEERVALEDLFAPIIDDMVILLSNTGIFWPSQNINTIGEWDTYKGYKVKFSSGVNFEFTGAELTDRTVSFEPGTHFVPVLSEGPASVNDVVVPLGAAVDFMFDITNALIYWPYGGIVPGVPSALETLYPGFAYLTKFAQPATLDFGTVPPKSAVHPTLSKTINITTWNDARSTGMQHIISVNATQLLSGDFVGVFDAFGTCVGLAQYKGEGQVLPLVVYGNDITTEAKDGLMQNEQMSFRIFRNGTEMAVTPIFDQSLANCDGTFAENGLSVITGFKMGATGINEVQTASFAVYPNPGTGVFTLATDIEGNYDVMVTNIQGQQVYSAKMNGTATINLTDQAKGIYFVRLSNAVNTLVKKIVIE